MNNHTRAGAKPFILSWLLVPLIAIWITTNYIIGLGRNPTWDASSNQELVHQVEAGSQSEQPLAWDGGPLITLWFDDAWSTQFDPGYDLMQQHGFKGAMAVPTSAVGTVGYMNWAQVKLLQHAGWEISSHSQSHNCTASELTAAFEDKELGGAKSDLSMHGIFADNYVAPCGTITPGGIAAAKKYYSSFRTSENGVNALPVTDPYNLHVHTIQRETSIDDINGWISEARDHNAWLILVVHQVDDGTAQYGMNRGMLSNTLDAVKDSKIPVVLPDQVLQMKVAK
jgi:peptidoglycan/xylan/chitin deacetylase (PgdA/CDA1 family)